MHTPTTTTRVPSGACETTDSIIPGTPTHSKTTGRAGVVAPAVSAARKTWRQPGTRRSLSIASTPNSKKPEAEVRNFFPGTSYGEPSAGSTSTCAPQRSASARRAGERSEATIVRTPRARSQQITASPTGPQPSTTATSFLATSPRLTACSATAIGSVSAATSGASPLGTTKDIDCSASTCSAYPPGASGDSPIGCATPSTRRSGSTATWSPSRNSLRTPRPRSRTSPTNSWPITVGRSRRMNCP